MSFIDVLIPGIIGLLLLIWPRFVFLGSSVTPDVKKIRLMRSMGMVLLIIAAVFLTIKIFSG